MTSAWLLLAAAAGVAIVHSILPDHWIPLAVVARTNRWSMSRVAKTTFLASIGHVIGSIVLGAIIALIGLRFRQLIETQQGHIVGILLILTGLVFMILRLMGKGGHSHADGHGHSHGHGHAHHHHHGHSHTHTHAHSHDHGQDHDHAHGHEHDHVHSHSHDYPFEWGGIYHLSEGEYHFVLNQGPDPAMKVAMFLVEQNSDSSLHQASHAADHIFKGTVREVSSGEILTPGQTRYDLRLSGDDAYTFQVTESGFYALFTEHHPDEFSATVQREGVSISPIEHEEYESEHDHDHSHQPPEEPKTLLRRIAAIAVPFGVAASPDLTILPVALAASAISAMLVVGVLVVFSIFTIATFLILTLLATKLGYQIKGDWLEKNAIAINSVMLIAIGIVAYVGF